MRPVSLIIALVLVLPIVNGARGQAGTLPPGQLPKVFDGVGIEERLGERLPLDLEFTTGDSEVVSIGDLVGHERPVILSFVYHSCPMLCSILLDELVTSMRDVEWTAGEEFDIVTVSISPDDMPEEASRARTRYVESYGREVEDRGWVFLTGTQESIDTLTQAVGFNFRWVEDTQEYAHPAALIFLTPDGEVSRYLHGMSHRPDDLRLALSEASEGTIGTTIDRLIMYCYRYDANASSYVLHATNLMRLGGGIMVVALGITLVMFWRKESQRLGKEPVAA